MCDLYLFSPSYWVCNLLHLAPSCPCLCFSFSLPCFPPVGLSHGFQPSEPDEGAGPAGPGVPGPAPRRGRVSHRAQVQARPGPEAEDPAPGAVPAAASGRPLSHRGVPRGDLWGQGATLNLCKNTTVMDCNCKVGRTVPCKKGIYSPRDVSHFVTWRPASWILLGTYCRGGKIMDGFEIFRIKM